MKHQIKITGLVSSIFLTIMASAASTDLNYLIPESTESAIEISLDKLSVQNQIMGARLEKALADMVEEQNRLIDAKRTIEDKGLDAAEFMHEFSNRFEALPNYVREILDGNQEFDVEDLKEKSHEFVRFFELVKAGEKYAGDFIEKYKAFSQKYSDINTAVSFYLLNLEIESLRSSPGMEQRLDTYRGTYQKILDAKNEYYENRHQFGKAKGVLRASPLNRFFALTKSLVTQMQKDEQMGYSPIRNQWHRITNRMRDVLYSPVDATAKYLGAKLKKTTLRLLKTVVLDRKVTPDSVPLVATVNAIVRAKGFLSGEKVDVINADKNYAVEKGPNVINILMPSHSHGFKDALGIANLKDNEMAFFAAAGNFLPDDVAKEMMPALNENLGIVVVGKKHNENPVDPVDKMIRIITEAGIQTFLLYPQGMLPTKDNSISPVREGAFDIDGPIRELERRGYKVNLIPISMPLNSSPFHLNLAKELPEGRKSSATVEIKIHKTIPDRIRHAFMRVTNAQAFPTLFHYGLMDELVSSRLPNGQLDPNGKLLWGQARIERIREIIGDYLKTKASPTTTKSCTIYYAL